MKSLDHRLNEVYLSSQDSGPAVQTILAAYNNALTKDRKIYTISSAEELGICIRLLTKVPEIFEGLDRLAQTHPTWKKYANNWNKLTDMYFSEAATENALRTKGLRQKTIDSKMAPKTTEFLDNLNYSKVQND